MCKIVQLVYQYVPYLYIASLLIIRCFSILSGQAQNNQSFRTKHRCISRRDCPSPSRAARWLAKAASELPRSCLEVASELPRCISVPFLPKKQPDPVGHWTFWDRLTMFDNVWHLVTFFDLCLDLFGHLIHLCIGPGFESVWIRLQLVVLCLHPKAFVWGSFVFPRVGRTSCLGTLVAWPLDLSFVLRALGLSNLSIT